MALEDIGFYTLSDERARNIGRNSPLWRCELILTERCNFKCLYCRGIREDCQGDMPLEKAYEIIKFWVNEGLKNIRFSGGEPTVYKHLNTLVAYANALGVERIAVSTNGFASHQYYANLVSSVVNDFSISLDACCSSTGELMCGGIKKAWERVTENIKLLSKLTYVTVGIVITDDNLRECENTIRFAHDLGVADIRVISAAQANMIKTGISSTPIEILNAHPILNYRARNSNNEIPMRGLNEHDCRTCHLVKDDMAVAGNYHFPCIIYLREGGKAIGDVGPNMRDERVIWAEAHDCLEDPICKNNCLDVCRDFNNTIEKFREYKTCQIW